MKTTVDLPDRLVREAMKVSKQKTKTGLIITALRDLVRRHRLQALKCFKGHVDPTLDRGTHKLK
ncbi:MAG: hypothetical protein C0404_02490 [Verrucomicrobia bacterium]|nr:hypothetical protein [Verrucomicrobiota bacterium]